MVWQKPFLRLSEFFSLELSSQSKSPFNLHTNIDLCWFGDESLTNVALILYSRFRFRARVLAGYSVLVGIATTVAFFSAAFVACPTLKVNKCTLPHTQWAALTALLPQAQGKRRRNHFVKEWNSTTRWLSLITLVSTPARAHLRHSRCDYYSLWLMLSR